jgi:hypothetical protein
LRYAAFMRGALFVVEMVGVWLGFLVLCGQVAEAHPRHDGEPNRMWTGLGAVGGFFLAAALAFPLSQFNDWLIALT